MRLHVLSDRRFSCHSCTNCCRHWHVELQTGEPERIRQLNWPPGDPLAGKAVIRQINDRPYLRQQADGACVFLNTDNGLCRIHEQFGFQHKPLGCLVFPFQYRRMQNGSIGVAGRYDCPSIQKNQGQPLVERQAELAGFASLLGLQEQAEPHLRRGMNPKLFQTVLDLLVDGIEAIQHDRLRAIWLMLASHWLDLEQTAGLSVGQVPDQLHLLARQAQTLSEKPPALNRSGRLAMRMLLATHLRRDEDVLERRTSGLMRSWAMARVAIGGGSLQSLGSMHPRAAIRKARLFSRPAPLADSDVMATFWQMVREKIVTEQFMGQSNFGRDVAHGLGTLASLYPLTLAAARCLAAGQQQQAVTAEHVQQAVGLIEHSFGRQPLLDMPTSRQLEQAILLPKNFVALVMLGGDGG